MRKIIMIFSSLIHWKHKLGFKLFFIFLLFIIIFTIFCSLLIYSQYRISCLTLNNVLKETLQIFTFELEKELENLEDLSYRIMTNSYLQESLEKIIMEDDESTSLLPRLMEDLANYYFLEPFLNSIQINTFSQLYFTEGQRISGLTETKIGELWQQALQREGDFFWIKLDNTTDDFLLVRCFRKVKNLEFTNLGVLFLNVNMERIISKLSGRFNLINPQIMIKQADELLYSSDKQLLQAAEVKHIDHSGAYSLVTTNRSAYFVTNIFIPQRSWHYLILLEYNEIISLIKGTMIFSTLALCITLVLLTLIGIRQTNAISRPITELASVMKKIEAVDFKLSRIRLPVYTQTDEIAVLYNDFNLLLEKLDFYINENLKKQITIQGIQLKNLQIQINPHFLYNTLDSINCLAKLQDQQQIATMVQALGDLFRASIKKKFVITLREEIALLNNYIAIEKIRFGQRLEIITDISPEVREYAVPKFILQPLVENSIKHGLEVVRGVCRIGIRIQLEHNSITIIITDNGPGIEQQILGRIINEQNKNGVGLSNIRQRLALIFPGTYQFNLDSTIGEGTSIKIAFPARQTGEIPAGILTGEELFDD